jgi:hypothetical protein
VPLTSHGTPFLYPAVSHDTDPRPDTSATSRQAAPGHAAQTPTGIPVPAKAQRPQRAQQHRRVSAGWRLCAACTPTRANGTGRSWRAHSGCPISKVRLPGVRDAQVARTVRHVPGTVVFAMDLVMHSATTGSPRQQWEGCTAVASYDTCRLVAVCHMLVKGGVVLEVSLDHVRVHDAQDAQGASIEQVLRLFSRQLQRARYLVAHNAAIQVGAIAAEMLRGGLHEEHSALLAKPVVCTMQLPGRQGLEPLRLEDPTLIPPQPSIIGPDALGVTASIAETVVDAASIAETVVDAASIAAASIAHDNPDVSAVLDAVAQNARRTFKCYERLVPRDARTFHFDNKQVLLTPEQEAVVFAPLCAHVCVDACAGAGKTTTMLCRIRHLVASGVPAERVLLLTFTREAACDMSTKLIALFGSPPAVVVGTIDGFARGACMRAGASDGFVGEFAHELLRLLRAQPALAAEYDHIIVDEAQDLCDVQYRIVCEYHRSGGAWITLVGDPKQNIYTFRGSSAAYMSDFASVFDPALTFRLSTNFRSTSPIVALANAVMPCSAARCDGKAWTVQGGMVAAARDDAAPQPTVRWVRSNTEQCAAVVAEVQTASACGTVGILAPTNRQLYIVEEALLTRGLQHSMVDSEAATRERPHDSVVLSTIHRSKGLEWDTVLLIGMCDANFVRHANPNDDDDDARRLCYVGVTRARTRVCVFHVSPRLCRYLAVCPQVWARRGVPPPPTPPTPSVQPCNACRSLMDAIRHLQSTQYIAMREAGVLPARGSVRCWRTWRADATGTLPGLAAAPALAREYVRLSVLRACALCRRVHSPSPPYHAARVLSSVCVRHDEAVSPAARAAFFVHRSAFSDGRAVRLACRALRRGAPASGVAAALGLAPSSANVRGAVALIQVIAAEAVENGIACEDVPVTLESWLTPEARRAVLAAVRAYTDPGSTAEQLAPHLWTLAACRPLSEHGRRGALVCTAATGVAQLPPDVAHALEASAAAAAAAVRDALDDLPCDWGGPAQPRVDFVAGRGRARVPVDAILPGQSTLLMVCLEPVHSGADAGTMDAFEGDTMLRALLGKGVWEQSHVHSHPLQHILIYRPLTGVLAAYDVSGYDAGPQLLLHALTWT